MLADNGNFDEVLISKRMVQDHMPDTVLSALEEVITLSLKLRVFPIVTKNPDETTPTLYHQSCLSGN